MYTQIKKYIKRCKVNYILIVYISIFYFSFFYNFLLHTIKMPTKDFTITRKEYELIAKRRGINDAYKMSTNTLKKVLNVEEYLLRKDYNVIAKNRGIKEPQEMTKKDLINT